MFLLAKLGVGRVLMTTFTDCFRIIILICFEFRKYVDKLLIILQFNHILIIQKVNF